MQVCLISCETEYRLAYGRSGIHKNDFHNGLYLSDYLWAYIICWISWDVNQMSKFMQMILYKPPRFVIPKFHNLCFNNDWIIRSFDMGYIHNFSDIKQSELVGMQAISEMYDLFVSNDQGCNVSWFLGEAIPIFIQNLLLNHRMLNGHRMSSYEKNYYCKKRLNSLFVLWSGNENKIKKIIKNAVHSVYQYLVKHYAMRNENLSSMLSNEEIFQCCINQYTDCAGCSANFSYFVLNSLSLK